MKYCFSERMGALKPSAIRELLKSADNPNTISLSAGNPAPEAFPVKEMAEIAADIFENRSAAALQYGISEGYTPLRQITAKRLREVHGTGGPNDDVLIVSGGQQGMDLAAKCFVNEGDTILCEAPSFIGSLNDFRSYNARLVGIPMEEDGIELNALEHALKTEKHVSLLYVIPTFQNPTGRVMSLAKRKALLELCAKYDVMIVEDNPYYELRYDGEKLPTIKSMDTEGRVIYVGSYSKVLSPGIRLGFVCADKEICVKMTVAKQVADVHTNQFFQMLAADYLTKYDLDEHIAQICRIYRERRDIMAEALRVYGGDAFRFEVPQGGLFLWCDLTSGVKDCTAFVKKASAAGVVAVPGSTFLVDEAQTTSAFRLNYSLPTPEQIEKGCRILGETARSM